MCIQHERGHAKICGFPAGLQRKGMAGVMRIERSGQLSNNVVVMQDMPGVFSGLDT